MTRAPLPPSMEDLSAPRPGAGDESVTIDLGGLAIVLQRLDEDLARRLRSRYAPYASDAEPRSPDPAPSVRPSGVRSEPTIRLALGIETRNYFIPPPAQPIDNPVVIALDGDRVRYAGHRLAGWFDPTEGRGEMFLGRGTYETDLHAIENFVRAALAWSAAVSGGALIHAASAVHRGAGYIFYGASGAGKSTLSASNRRARIVSDDLSLVLPGAGDRLELVGSPFRGTYAGAPPVVGRFPLLRGFRLIKDDHAEVRFVPRARAFAELVANLPFVVDSLPARPDLFARFERTFAPLALAHLHFAKDDSFWDAIEAAGN